MALSVSQRDWLALSMTPGIGTTYFIRLLARFGTPTRVFQASEAELAEIVGPKLTRRIRQYSDTAQCVAQEKALLDYQASLITLDDQRYPARLAEIYDPPLVLFQRGNLPEPEAPAVAIVGTRSPSPHGVQMTERLASELAARGIVVISGMAEGIDSAAHRGALRVQGPTVAVLGCGVDVVYPASNAGLMHSILQQGGAVVSQYAMGVKPGRGHFPQRNRIISGLSLGVLIVEAPPGSGSLITARFAAEQGREVFAVPGQVGHRNSKGPHALIREGAKLVENVEDILAELELPEAYRSGVATPDAMAVTVRTEDAPAAPPHERPPQETAATTTQPVDEPAPLSPTVSRVLQNRNLSRSAHTATTPPPRQAPAPSQPPQPQPKPNNPPLKPMEKEILSVLHAEGSFVDEIAMACRMPLSEALSTLTMLEIKGLVQQFSGKRFARR